MKIRYWLKNQIPITILVILLVILAYLFIPFDFTAALTIADTINLMIFIAAFFALVFQHKQFERNQFENKFFEMLKVHKENSNVIENKVFSKCYSLEEKEFNGFVVAIKELYNLTKEENESIFFTKKVYSVFWDNDLEHYFRHLFLMVKFVVSKNERFLSYNEKRDYLRILRASLSVNEQIFIYYNWLSGYGEKWENKENKFFTNYRMIHNINPDLLIKDFDVRKISPFKELLKKPTYRKENKEDTLFEFEDWK